MNDLQDCHNSTIYTYMYMYACMYVSFLHYFVIMYGPQALAILSVYKKRQSAKIWEK